jgi:hypothetical protein
VKKHKKKVIVAATTTTTGKSDGKRPHSSEPPLVVAATSGASSSTPLFILLGIALGLALLVVVLGLTPASVLPRPVLALVYNRRDALIFGGFAIAAGLGLGLAIAATLA